MPKAKDKYNVVTLRVTPDEKQLLTQLAQQQERSVHNYIRKQLNLSNSIFPRTPKKGGIKNGE